MNEPTQYQTKPERDYTRLVVISLVVLLLVAAGYISYEKLYTPKLEENYVAGYNQGVADTMVAINQNAEIPILSLENNQTTVNWVSIQEICAG